jgi:hypothetical protein
LSGHDVAAGAAIGAVAMYALQSVIWHAKGGEQVLHHQVV